MRIRRLFHTFLTIGLLLAPWCASNALCASSRLDSVLNLPAMAVPVLSYSPETNWEFGAASQYYFVCPGQKRTSIVQLDGSYSFRKQWYINALGTVYFGKQHSWLVYFRAGYRNYPDTYYSADQSTRYNSKRFLLKAQPQYCFASGWSVGLNVDALYEITDYYRFYSEQPSKLDSVGILGLGVLLQYDSRDVTYYPHNGIFFKLAATHYEDLLRTYGRLGKVDLDFRQFVPIYNNLIFAYQLSSSFTFGTIVPFQLQSTLGGQDLLRGVRRNRYRDNAMLALQTELRIPIWTLLHATIFAGVGDTYNLQSWQWRIPQVGYGLGLRISINQAKVNLRFDVARSAADKSWNNINSYSFYFTATEAF